MVTVARWTPDPAIHNHVLAGVTVLCSWVKTLSLTVPLSMGTGEISTGVTCDRLASHPGE